MNKHELQNIRNFRHNPREQGGCNLSSAVESLINEMLESGKMFHQTFNTISSHTEQCNLVTQLNLSALREEQESV